MDLGFTGKIVLVTGGGSGIGRAVSIAAAKEGASVVLVDVDEKGGSETAAMIEQSGGKARFIRADVSKAEDVENYVAKTMAEFGQIDVFYNNAGIEGVVKPIFQYPDDVFDKVVSVNIRGVYLGLKHVLPVMIKQNKGSVVMTSSTAGYSNGPGMVAYVASKHAVLGMMKTAAAEVVKLGIRVNAVCPGPVNTQMMRELENMFAPGAPAAAAEKVASTIPDGRYAEPEEVANLMLYLASDAASHITSQAFIIDGGQTLR